MLKNGQNAEGIFLRILGILTEEITLISSIRTMRREQQQSVPL